MEALTNLDTAWDIMIENKEVFNENDLFILLSAHLGETVAEALRNNSVSQRPCYDFLGCEECLYFKFCLKKSTVIKLRSTEECQETLKKFVSSFH